MFNFLLNLFFTDNKKAAHGGNSWFEFAAGMDLTGKRKARAGRAGGVVLIVALMLALA